MKKNIRKLIASLLVAVMLLTAAPLAGIANFDWNSLFATRVSALASSGKCGTNVKYTFDSSTGLLTISGTGAMKNYSSNCSPFYCNDSIKSVVIENGVTSIGDFAFEDCYEITSATIPDGVKRIGDRAFCNCEGLTSITIPDSVTNIGKEAFYLCVGLETITVDENNTVYDSRENCNAIIETSSNTLITGCISTIIPDSVTSIDSYAFCYCYRLTSVTIPNSVTSIGGYAFNGCTSLTSITIPDSVTSIDEGTFWGCTGLTSITIPDGVKRIGDRAFYNCTGLTSITIPDSVTSIGGFAFENCTGLTSVIIPSSVNNIEDSTFAECSGLTSITIPDNVTSIGSYAFSGCTSLTNVIIGNSVTSIGNSAFSDTAYYNNPSNWQNDILYIGNYLIEAKTSLSGSYAVKSKTKLIADSAFCNCLSLTSITIPDSVTSIGDSAFYNCTGLKEITMPCSAKTYNSSDTFYNCTNIEKVTLTAGTGAMQNFSSSSVSSTTYYQYTPWYISRANFKELIIEDGVKSISSCAFSGCTGLTSVTIPNSVTSIGSYAFSRCTRLTSVTIPNSVTSIGSDAFSGCTGLTSVTIPNSVTSIGSSAFSGCTGLTSVTISDSVTKINDSAFYGCTGLTSIIIPDSVVSIGRSSFGGCTGLASITISDSVTSIDSYAFNNCTGLKEITMPCSAKISYYNTFENCYGIEKVTLTAGNGTMQNFSSSTGSSTTYYKYTPWYISRANFKELVIEYGVKNIGSYAFYDTNLTDIYYTGTSAQWNSISKGSSYKPSGTVIHCNYIVPGSVISEIRVDTQPSKTVYHKDSEFNPAGMTVYAVGEKKDTLVTDYDVSYDFNEVGETNVTISFVFEGTEYTTQVPVTVAEHLYEHVVVPSTCTEEGTEYDLCTECGEVANESVIPKLPHSYVSVVTAPTCTEQGYTTYTCSCGESYIDSYVNALSHNFGEWVITAPATCTKNGVETRYCVRCDVTETRETDLAPHSYSHIVESSTCTKEGQEYDLCTECGEIINVSVIEKLPHNLTHAVIPASCSGAGSEFDICIDCGTQVNVSVIPALEHSFSHIHTDATCTEIGEDYDICEVCGQMFNIVETQKLSHNLTHSVVEATCTEDGAEYDICSECGQKFNEVIAPATGHDTTHVSVTKTCTVDGEEYDLCSKCGEKLNYTIDKAKGHNYTHLTIPSSCTANGMEFDYCIVCQTQDNVTIVPAAHTWGEWNITIYPTTISDGTSERICGKCGTKETKTLAKTISNCVIEDDTIYGLSAGMTVDSFTANNLVENGVTVTTTPSDGNSMGTGSKVVLTYPDGQTVEYEIVVFGDTNGDAWYDGTDSIIVNCLAAGMLSKAQVGDATYTAADCNHDGVIDSADVAILEQAGLILASVDQSKSQAELMTDSAYVEYLSLIDQSPAEEIITENTSVVSTETEEKADTENAPVDNTEKGKTSANKTSIDKPEEKPVNETVSKSFIQRVFDFIIYLFKMMKSFIPKF